MQYFHLQGPTQVKYLIQLVTWAKVHQNFMLNRMQKILTHCLHSDSMKSQTIGHGQHYISCPQARSYYTANTANAVCPDRDAPLMKCRVPCGT